MRIKCHKGEDITHREFFYRVFFLFGFYYTKEFENENRESNLFDSTVKKDE